MPNNMKTLFYLGEVPWHEEGVMLKTPLSTKEAIKKSGLGWNVHKEKLFLESGSQVNDYYGVVRSDNKKVLGVVKKEYKPLQNEEAFGFFEPLIKNDVISFEIAGSIGEGEIVWIQAKLNKNSRFSVIGDDVVEKYLLLSNSHNGLSSVSIKFTPIRVVCQNTLSVALKEPGVVRIKHLSKMRNHLENMRKVASNISRTYDGIEDTFINMAKYKMKEKELEEYFDRIYPVPKDPIVRSDNDEKRLRQNTKTKERLYEIMENGYGAKAFRSDNTLWAAYNAVTEHIDHPADYKMGANKFLKRIWFGEGEALKKKAYEAAIALLKTA